MNIEMKWTLKVAALASTTWVLTAHALSESKLIAKSDTEEKWTLTVMSGAYSKIYLINNSSTTIMHGFNDIQDCMKTGAAISNALDAGTKLIGHQNMEGNPYSGSICRKERLRKK